MQAYVLGFHIATALIAVVLGACVIAMNKGTTRHKLLGRVWVALMGAVAVGSFAIQELNSGRLSWTHGLSTFTLIAMGYAIFNIRKGRRQAHAMGMIGCFIGLIIAGIFTLNPHRLIGTFLFGG